MDLINKYKQLLNDLPNLNIRDQDGYKYKLEMNYGLNEDSIIKWEKDNNITLPDDLRLFLQKWNGGKLFCLIIDRLENYLLNISGLITFHNWGNGDFDCIEINKNEYYIFFYNHNNGAKIKIANYFSEWLIKVINEITKVNTILHPMDYQNFQEYQGIYSFIKYYT